MILSCLCFVNKDLLNIDSTLFTLLIHYQSVSPMGSRENLRSPQSPTELSDWMLGGSRKSSSANNDHIALSRHPSENEQENQSTSEMFKDMLSLKRNVLFNKLTSFESEVGASLATLVGLFISWYFLQTSPKQFTPTPNNDLMWLH